MNKEYDTMYHMGFPKLSSLEGIARSQEFYQTIRERRTIRHFAPTPVPRKLIENAVLSAGSAPSGANKQPWIFVCVESAETKKEIRKAAEAEERSFYAKRAKPDLLEDLAPLGTTPAKPSLEEASHLIVVFAKLRELIVEPFPGAPPEPDSTDKDFTNTYYAIESTCFATGILLTALHLSGLATLTHTPNPMRFLNQILGVGSYCRPLVIVATGYPQEPIMVPKIRRKHLDQIARFV